MKINLPVRLVLLVLAVSLSILPVIFYQSVGWLAVVCALAGAVITGLIATSAVRNFNAAARQALSAALAGRSKMAEFEAISKISDAILVARNDRRITYINGAAADLFGNVIGRNLADVVGEGVCESIFANGVPRDWSGDIAGRKYDGTGFDGFLRAAPIIDVDAPAGVAAVIHDVTHDKNERESIMQSEKMITLGQLVAGTSHELNNPLAIVTGYSDLLLEEGNLTSDQRTKIESIRRNALRASAIVHSLLAFARKRKPQRISTDLNQVVEAAVQLKEYDLRTSGIWVEKRLAPIPPVFADPNQLQQVLLNIINNAQDAVLSGISDPRIVVRTETVNHGVLIKVKDSGPGIAKPDLKKVFDPFFTTKPVGKGTGLGLSISYGIIREHGGDIRIESRVGEGTEVTIELPVDEAVPVPVSKPVERQANAGLRLLVVDDEADIASILQRGLSNDATVVDIAASLSEAVSRAVNNEYDFVLSDVKMPGGSGIDLYRQLCAIKPAYKERTVFLTGDTSNPDTIQFFEAQGLTYFSKPFDLAAMVKFFNEKR